MLEHHELMLKRILKIFAPQNKTDNIVYQEVLGDLQDFNNEEQEIGINPISIGKVPSHLAVYLGHLKTPV